MNEKLKEARKNLAKAKMAIKNATENDDLDKLFNEEKLAREAMKNTRYEDFFERLGERNEKHKRR